ncbi:heparinase II/III family protein [Prolixibacteraceae bacterium Z1-6]|uniref:Heparinase II/III family protein n=1 Tax=Draconibacterium aestuarii TaxID=2998507 RepID=A0A9X3F1V7_9BACT|nr:heparinase II/III family protein [Prolixibacteraceae bacterium Z1-6]
MQFYKAKLYIGCLLLLFLWCGFAIAQTPGTEEESVYKLENPFSVDYLKQHLSKKLPRLVLNKETETNLRKKLETDPLIKSIYQSIKFNAGLVLEKEIITIDIPDNPNSQRNQLGISRDFLWRMNMLSMVYRIEKDQGILDRINEELIAACNFPTWNPRHFLDVGEMCLAVAMALDWTAGDLPSSTIELAKTALIEKGIKTSWPDNGETLNWVYNNNNWNQVCNCGMIAASIAVAELKPELAAKTIHRSVDGMNNALAVYAPDGVYPEGAIYWGYGTQFTAVTAAMFESAFGSDFGILNFPGLKESAVFRMLSESPTKRLYNYADCAEQPERYTEFTLSWFAAKTGNKAFLKEETFLMSPEERGRISRLAGAGLVWTAQFEEKQTEELPTSWKGEGANPIVVFTGGSDDTKGYYFGGKGGRGSINHGNMDAGSFTFELNGVRWSVDPGNQGYGPLERAGFNLWGRNQDSDRWKLITKNNFGHSTLSVNNQLHKVDGLATLEKFSGGEKPEATFNLTPVFGELLKSAERTFIKNSPNSLVINDKIELSKKTELITWQMITTADVEITKGGAVLAQDSKKVKLEVLSHPEMRVSVISLYPAPLKLDKQIEQLKRIEIRYPAWIFENKNIEIQVQLTEL